MLICITSTGKVSETLMHDLTEDFFMQFAGQEMTLDGEELDLVTQIVAAEVPVYDLAAGMFPYVPLDGAESNAEAVSEVPATDDMGDWPEWLKIDLRNLGLTTQQMKEVEDRVHHAIRVRENLHPQTTYTNGTRNVEIAEISAEDKQKYYKSKTGKLRKAGPRAKARPGEEEMWLTNDEYESMQ